MRQITLAVFTALLFIASGWASPALATELFTRMDDRGIELESPVTFTKLKEIRKDPFEKLAFAVRIDPTGFNQKYITVPIPNGQTILFERMGTSDGIDFKLFDGMSQSAGATISIHLNGKTVNGHARVGGANYRIVGTSDNFAIIHIFDLSKAPPPHPSDYEQLTPSIRGGESNRRLEGEEQRRRPLATATSSHKAVLEILVVYTANAARSVGGDGALLVKIENAKDDLNRAFDSSKVFASSQIVAIKQVSFPEDPNFNTMLKGAMADATLASMRKSTKADIVVLYTGQGAICGLATLDARNPETAFAVLGTKEICFETYAFAHEIAHIMGADHDLTNATKPPSSYPYGHGYVHLANNPLALSCHKTIMSYPSNCTDINHSPTPTIRYFSNPDVTYTDSAPRLGDTLSNNAKVINENALMVASFNGGSSVTPPSTSEASSPSKIAAMIRAVDLILQD